MWLVKTMRPGDAPLLALEQTLSGNFRFDTGYNESIEPIVLDIARDQRLLLVIDQFEELFVQANREQQARFIAALRAIRMAKNCTIIILLRADFYPELLSSELWPVAPGQRIEIAPLRGESLRQAIEQPAATMGVQLEAGLLERLLADAADEPGILPLVQETMTLLWEMMERRLLPLSAYTRLGGEE